MYLITAVVAGYLDVWKLSQRKVYLDQEPYKRDILCVRVFPDTRKEETVRKFKFFCVIYWMGVNARLGTGGGNDSPCTQNTGHVRRTVAGVKWKDNI